MSTLDLGFERTPWQNFCVDCRRGISKLATRCSPCNKRGGRQHESRTWVASKLPPGAGPDLVELKREQMLLRRAIGDLKQAIKEPERDHL